MTAGKIFFTGLLALVLAIGASSTASARSSCCFRIPIGDTVVSLYVSPPAVGHPHYHVKIYPAAHEATSLFSVGIHGLRF